MGRPRGALTFVVSVVLIARTGSAWGQSVSDKGRMLYWGFDKLFVGSLEGRRVDLKPIDLHGTVKNIISVSVAGDVAAVVGRQRASDRPAVFILQWRSGKIDATLQKEVYEVALGPTASRLAFTSYSRSTDDDDFADIGLRDLATGKEVVLVRERGSPGTNLTWHPDAKTLTFDFQRVLSRSVSRGTGNVTRSLRSSIESVDLESGRVTTLCEGSAPAWSRDGKKLAYRRGKTVFLYDPVEGKSSKLYTRSRWKKDFVGNICWSPKGDYLALNATAGVMDQGLECVVIKVGSGRAISLGKGSYSCGPWLETGTSVATRRGPSN